MKKLLLILLVAFFGCKKDNNKNHHCTIVIPSNDTLVVDQYKLCLTTVVGTAGEALIEIDDLNENEIVEAENFKINLIQIGNANDCWETKEIEVARLGSYSSYAGFFRGFPEWTRDTSNRAAIQITISGKSYFLTDQHVNRNY